MGPPDFEHVFITVIALIISTAIVIYFWLKRKKSASAVLLVGITTSGKTTLYLRLLHESSRATFTSITPNDGQYKTAKGTTRIIDIPGQERLRLRYFDYYKDEAKGLIFVVDSTTIATEIRDVAEFLYTILTDSCIRSKCPNILILCNKQDSDFAKDVAVVQSLLQKELNILRVTKSKQLEGIENDASKKAYLGNKKKDFDFSHCKPLKVEFAKADCYKSNSAIGVAEVQKWFQNLR